MNRPTMIAALLIATLAGCEQKPKAEPTPTATATAQPARGTETATAVDNEQALLDQVPVAEDFEEQAAREITASNLESHLDSLEQEIGE